MCFATLVVYFTTYNGVEMLSHRQAVKLTETLAVAYDCENDLQHIFFFCQLTSLLYPSD